MHNFVHAVTGIEMTDTAATVHLQEIVPGTGRTDVELQVGGEIHIIIEAKRAWQLPSDAQLAQYVRRLRSSNAQTRLILVLTDCSRDYVGVKGAPTSLLGTHICYRSWADFVRIASDCRKRCTPAQRILVNEVLAYLKELITMQQIDSNRAYVVSLSHEQPEGWKTSWINVVRKQRR